MSKNSDKYQALVKNAKKSSRHFNPHVPTVSESEKVWIQRKLQAAKLDLNPHIDVMRKEIEKNLEYYWETKSENEVFIGLDQKL